MSLEKPKDIPEDETLKEDKITTETLVADDPVQQQQQEKKAEASKPKKRVNVKRKQSVSFSAELPKGSDDKTDVTDSQEKATLVEPDTDTGIGEDGVGDPETSDAKEVSPVKNEPPSKRGRRVYKKVVYYRRPQSKGRVKKPEPEPIQEPESSDSSDSEESEFSDSSDSDSDGPSESEGGVHETPVKQRRTDKAKLNLRQNRSVYDTFTLL